MLHVWIINELGRLVVTSEGSEGGEESTDAENPSKMRHKEKRITIKNKIKDCLKEKRNMTTSQEMYGVRTVQ